MADCSWLMVIQPKSPAARIPFSYLVHRRMMDGCFASFVFASDGWLG